jgi:hypothetical protein
MSHKGEDHASSPAVRESGHKKTREDRRNKAFVLQTFQAVVKSGQAFWRTRSKHQTELCLLSGEIFILDDVGVKRVV